MPWLWNRYTKANFYVWYLGSKEADGVRGSAVVLPVMRQLLRDSFRKTPNKATVQISIKGLKLIQTVLTMSKNGKMKMQLVKIQIPANCITYSMIGKPPFDDVVGVVMLVLNPEMHSPMHIHCYRCDSPETASMMQANLQVIIGRPENQKAIIDLESRLFVNGLITPRPRTPPRVSHSVPGSLRGYIPLEPSSRHTKRLYNELKSKLSRAENDRDHHDSSSGVHFHTNPGVNIPQYLKNKRFSISDLPSVLDDPKFRVFGEHTMARNPEKSRSMSVENLHTSGVSKILDHKHTESGSKKHHHMDQTDPFGHIYEHSLSRIVHRPKKSSNPGALLKL